MGRTFVFSLLSLILLANHVARGDEFETVTSEKFSATLTAVSPVGEVTGEGLPRKLQLSELRSYVRLPTKELPPGKIVVEGHAGAKLNVQKLTFTGDEFRAVCDSGLELTLPFDGLRGIRFEPATAYVPLDEALAKPSKESDVIFMKVDKQIERISGLLAGITDTEIMLDVAGEKRKVPRDRVFAVVLAQSNAGAAVTAIIATDDGSRLAVKNLEVRENLWKLQLVGGSKCEIAGDKIWRVDFRPPGLVFLSDLEPLSAKEEPLFTAPLTWKRDRSVSGNPLTLASQKFEKGLGVHSRSELTFAVPAESNVFIATIGIDDETRRNSSNRKAAGDCEFIVLGDDRELFSGRVQSADAPKTIRMDLRNVKRLTLLVEPGEDFDFADHADWCDARFLKLPK